MLLPREVESETNRPLEPGRLRLSEAALHSLVQHCTDNLSACAHISTPRLFIVPGALVHSACSITCRSTCVKIETSAFGDEKPLDKSTVIELQTQNPNQPPETRIKNFRSSWLAYNRRVDVVLLPTNRESLRFYPNNAPDSDLLWQRPIPSPESLEKDQ